METKNFFDDLKDRFTSWTSTIIGGAQLIVSILIFLGKMTIEQGDQALPLVESWWGAIIAVVAAIAGAINLFSKDETKIVNQVKKAYNLK